MTVSSSVQTQKNAFLNDSVLFRLAAQLPSGLLPGFEEIGAFVASREGHDLSRLVNRYRPTLCRGNSFNDWAEYVEQHPSYYALQRRTRQWGLTSSLWERSGAENGCRYQARAIRLMLLAGLETSHLNEVITLSAASAVLSNERELFAAWENILLSRQYDVSNRPYQQKHGGNLALAFTAPQEWQHPLIQVPTAQKIAYDDRMNRDLYRLSATKTNVVGPLCDGYLVTAHIDGALGCFLVPRFQDNGAANGLIRVDYLQNYRGEAAIFEGQLTFINAHGWLLGGGDGSERIIQDLDTMIRFDYAVTAAGVLRAALDLALAHYRDTGRANLTPLVERILADIALDVAAAQALVLRLAKAFDKTFHDRSEAAFARMMTPIISYHLNQLVVPILGELITQVGPSAFHDDARLGQMFVDAPLRIFKGVGDNNIITQIIELVQRTPGLFQQLLEKIAVDIGSAGPGTVEILKTIVSVASTDEGSGRLFVEQMGYAASAAVLRQLGIEPLANAYIESRLGGQWRSSYGMLSARHHARQILELISPSA